MAEGEVAIKVRKSGMMKIKMKFLKIKKMIAVTQKKEKLLIWLQVQFLTVSSLSKIISALLIQILHKL